jgi:SAM-dependent methyltransferase
MADHNTPQADVSETPPDFTAADWSRFRVETISLGTFAKRNLIHRDLLWQVWKRARTSVLEVGVGSGAQSALLSRLIRHTITLDNDLRILREARPNLERFGPATTVVAGDAFCLPFQDGSIDVSLSQGLMEHFSDEQIVALVREQLRVCRSVVFSVPSDRYPRQDVGNERLMPPARWAEILAPAVPATHRVRARYYRMDLESIKYSIKARRSLGGFSVLVTIDPAG